MTKYRVALSVDVEAETAEEAFATVDRDMRQYLWTWPGRVEVATALIDGDDDAS